MLWCYFQGVALTENQGRCWVKLMIPILPTFPPAEPWATQALRMVRPEPRAPPALQGAKSDSQKGGLPGGSRVHK